MASSVQHSAHTVDKALNTADLRVLVACLYHLTGDEKWLSDEMRPQRDVRLVADPMAGFSQETADFIKNAARDWLLSDTSEPAITDPGPDTFGKMMSFFLGEEVPPEYVPMIRKDFGYSPKLPRGKSPPQPTGDRALRLSVPAHQGYASLTNSTSLGSTGISTKRTMMSEELGMKIATQVAASTRQTTSTVTRFLRTPTGPTSSRAAVNY